MLRPDEDSFFPSRLINTVYLPPARRFDNLCDKWARLDSSSSQGADKLAQIGGVKHSRCSHCAAGPDNMEAYAIGYAWLQVKWVVFPSMFGVFGQYRRFLSAPTIYKNAFDSL